LVILSSFVKPAINLAAGKNPDGSWGIGISNLCGLGGSFPPLSVFYPSQSWNVTIAIDELKSTNLTFDKFLSNAQGTHIQPQGTVQFVNGKAKIEIHPTELITLRSK